jgi:hypothetical protein
VSADQEAPVKPWDYHPDLTVERLIAVAQLLASGRGRALDRHEPSIGCDAWTLGVEAFNFGRHAINRAAGEAGFEWLTVPDSSRRLQFRMGDVPMRFYRGLAADPTPRMLLEAPIELEQYPLPLGAAAALDGSKFRIAVETDEEGTIVQISFVAIRGRAVETIWPIPYEDATPLIVGLGAPLAQGRELPAPAIAFADDEGEGGISASGSA